MPRPAPLSEQMKALLRGKKSRYAIAKATGIDVASLSRFISGKRSLSAAAWDELGKYLCLELIESHWTPTPGERIEEALRGGVFMPDRPAKPSARSRRRTS